MSENTTQAQAFKLKGRLYTFTVLHVLSTEPEIFLHQLDDTVAKAPKLFEHTPIVFDLSSVHQLEFDLQSLLQMARAHGMIPVAIQGGSAVHNTLAQCHGLAVLHASSTQDKPIIERPIENNHYETTKPLTKLITTPVRSGQQVVAKGGDLVIASSVSHGAELLADGCIHVYGALRGRALAGISGDKEARIFCQSLEAELVSIAGFYRLSDAIEPHNGPCQIYLMDEHIHIEPL
ncbi:septum site-determining protein MinC [Fluoribacter dumoffii]|uniref:Probable septum site-determining protein MinC n=1 Tax=Fluoribacter dumoffii TaxID=463 RepID=A0A377GA15_9GAMM|nr:septum site-determining protein MinC [Fluoribacter dumoffii]KTC90231.1 cell division inhibitor MinC (septum placement) [Fluoribacter dumoffii NY 23]MCW8418577.1 septum site-determining protein MinC [Fluoribacter dumoffii]MCW8453581.1 septum site-determining protein MinC [Fluoribacter dumoffii]MCW8459201.1 septum site-determining protein MinC [Fluoribacter dumoffii]MCW8482560.1 septum site-determining protein MinC [Fluoribacter dumoffii]